MSFLLNVTHFENKKYKFSARRANCEHTSTFDAFEHFLKSENGEEIRIFPLTGGENKGFWPKYLPLKKSSRYTLFYIRINSVRISMLKTSKI